MSIKAYDHDIAQTYDRGADGYHLTWPHRHAFTTPERNNFLKRMPQGGAILDVGCGPGMDSEYFAGLGYEVTGIDLSAKFIDIARARVPQARFERADMRHLNFPDAHFDGIWSSFSFLHIAENEAAATLRGLLRMLKPGGLLFIALHAADETRSSITPISGLLDGGEQLSVFVQEWSLEDFKTLLEEAGLDILVFRPFTRTGGRYPLLSTLSVKK